MHERGHPPQAKRRRHRRKANWCMMHQIQEAMDRERRAARNERRHSR